jgi:hypothetical protein
LIGWRAVLRERLERRSLDTHAGGAGRMDAAAVPLADADAPTLGGLLDTAALALGADATRLNSAYPDRGPAIRPPVHARRGLQRASTPAAVPPGADPGESDTRAGAPWIAVMSADVPADVAREHAAGARALLCRLAVDSYAGLPVPTQQLFWTRLIEGSSWADVAERARTTEAGAKRRFQRAVRTLAVRVAAGVRELPAPQGAILTAYCTRLGFTLPDAPGRGESGVPQRRALPLLDGPPARGAGPGP